MKGKALAALREAWATLRWMLFVICLGAYGGAWLVWIVGGLLLLEELGITAILPDSGVFFTVATIVVMAIGGEKLQSRPPRVPAIVAFEGLLLLTVIPA